MLLFLTKTKVKQNAPFFLQEVREAAKHNGLAIMRRGEGVKGRAIMEKNYFFYNFFFQHSKVPTAIKLEGGGGRPLWPGH